MSIQTSLKKFDNKGQVLEEVVDQDAIKSALGALKIDYQRWATDPSIHSSTSPKSILSHYTRDIEAIKNDYQMLSVDIIALTPNFTDDPAKKASVRNGFLKEHTHSEDEVRYFVDGDALFYINTGSTVYTLLCTRGDLIAIPAGTKHWFDMGENPEFTAIRFFQNKEGWVAQYTGDAHVGKYPLYSKPRT